MGGCCLATGLAHRAFPFGLARLPSLVWAHGWLLLRFCSHGLTWEQAQGVGLSWPHLPTACDLGRGRAQQRWGWLPRL